MAFLGKLLPVYITKKTISCVNNTLNTYMIFIDQVPNRDPTEATGIYNESLSRRCMPNPKIFPCFHRLFMPQYCASCRLV